MKLQKILDIFEKNGFNEYNCSYFKQEDITDIAKELLEAINYTHCCKSDSELFTPNDVKLPKENKPISMHTDSKKPITKKV